MVTVPEISLAVLVFSGVGFGVLLTIPSAAVIGLPLEERLLKVIKEQHLPQHVLLQWRSIITHSLSNPTVLWVFGTLYLVACVLMLTYLSFPETIWDTVAKVGIISAFGTTLGVTGWVIIVPITQYRNMRWAVSILKKLR